MKMLCKTTVNTVKMSHGDGIGWAAWQFRSDLFRSDLMRRGFLAELKSANRIALDFVFSGNRF